MHPVLVFVLASVVIALLVGIGTRIVVSRRDKS